jgi:hypothetical protein
MPEAIAEIEEALRNDDAARVRTLLQLHPELQARINDPVAPFDAPVITCVRSREMLDALLDGAPIVNAKSRWWAGGFGLLHTACAGAGGVCDRSVARSWMFTLRRALARWLDCGTSSPQTLTWCMRVAVTVKRRSFCEDVEVAEFLLEHGADIDARDVDHESTPAQYMVGDRQEVARYLVQRGCKTDILLGGGARRCGSRPQASRCRPGVHSDARERRVVPMHNAKAGGTIYQWTLGWHVSAHDVARKFRPRRRPPFADGSQSTGGATSRCVLGR